MSKDMLGQVVRALVGVPHEYHGTLLDAVNRLNDRDLANAAKFARNLKLFLRGELSVSEPTRSWREEDGVIYFSVTSDGTTGEEWINRLEGNDFRMINYPKSVLRSPDFKPTTGVTTKIGVLKGMLFSDDDRITKKIRAEADRRTFTKPNAEVACLVRTKFTDPEIEAMGLFGIVVMHEPIKDSDGDPSLLSAHRYGDGRWLHAYYDGPGCRWIRGRGFAFVASQVGA